MPSARARRPVRWRSHSLIRSADIQALPMARARTARISLRRSNLGLLFSVPSPAALRTAGCARLQRIDATAVACTETNEVYYVLRDAIGEGFHRRLLLRPRSSSG